MATFQVTDDTCSFINREMDCSLRRGDLKNLTRKEFATLLLEYADEALALTEDGQNLIVSLPDGRVLIYYHHIFPATERLPELREWLVRLYTLKQKTPRSLRKWYSREAWLYLAPYTEESGYKTDPTGKWSYRVWA